MSSEHAMTLRPKQKNEVALRTLFDALVSGGAAIVPHGAIDQVRVTGITLDSRDVRPGDLYVGMPGSKAHGSEFLRQALRNGAVAMVTDAQGWRLAGDEIPGIEVENPRIHLGSLSACVYDTDSYDALKFGVTGTNGKTSVIYMLAELVEMLHMSTGISTTAERRIGEEVIMSSLTSPEASELHALLARMKEEHVRAVCVEISAQAVVRNRIDGVLFDVVAFNNFSQDHLDEFGSMDAYFSAKSALFSPLHAKRGVVVVDSQWGRKIVSDSKIPVTTLASEYGSEADWHFAVTSESLDGTSFVLSGPEGAHFRARVPQLGKFMAENAALAIVMLLEAGIPGTELSNALGSSGLIEAYIPGRLENMSQDSRIRFYVDYGHTPGAFEVMLDALNRLVEGRVIMLFGADGDRDPTKRESMGAIAAKGSDVLIVCDYNPRTEDPAEIRAALLAGARSAAGSGTEILEIADPGSAVRKAIEIATPNDVILYAGPGHEEFREVAGKNIPFSAREEVRIALREAGFNA